VFPPIFYANSRYVSRLFLHALNTHIPTPSKRAPTPSITSITLRIDEIDQREVAIFVGMRGVFGYDVVDIHLDLP
jgi:hypothetical protein